MDEKNKKEIGRSILNLLVSKKTKLGDGVNILWNCMAEIYQMEDLSFSVFQKDISTFIDQTKNQWKEKESDF